MECMINACKEIKYLTELPDDKFNAFDKVVDESLDARNQIFQFLHELVESSKKVDEDSHKVENLFNKHENYYAEIRARNEKLMAMYEATANNLAKVEAEIRKLDISMNEIELRRELLTRILSTRDLALLKKTCDVLSTYQKFVGIKFDLQRSQGSELKGFVYNTELHYLKSFSFSKTDPLINGKIWNEVKTMLDETE